MELKNYVRSVPDFPKKGILYRDITPILKDSSAFKFVVKLFNFVASWIIVFVF